MNLNRVVFFVMGAAIWFTLKPSPAAHQEKPTVGLSEVEKKPSYLAQITAGILGFVQSIWIGARLVLGHRRFICELLTHHIAGIHANEFKIPVFSQGLFLHS